MFVCICTYLHVCVYFCVLMCLCVCVNLPTPAHEQDVTQCQFLSGVCCLNKAKEHCLPYYLFMAGGRIVEFILFPTLLAQCEIQTATSRIWTRVAVIISHDDIHYTTCASSCVCMYACRYLCVFACVFMCTVCVCVCMCVCLYVLAYECVHTPVCVCVCMLVCVYLCICLWLYACVRPWCTIQIKMSQNDPKINKSYPSWLGVPRNLQLHTSHLELIPWWLLCIKSRYSLTWYWLPENQFPSLITRKW